MFQLGIDVSKKTLDLCLLHEGVKGRVKTRKLQNDINAVSAVITWRSKQHCKPEDVHIIMVATGVCHESLAYGFHTVLCKLADACGSGVYGCMLASVTMQPLLPAS